MSTSKRKLALQHVIDVDFQHSSQQPSVIDVDGTSAGSEGIIDVDAVTQSEPSSAKTSPASKSVSNISTATLSNPDNSHSRKAQPKTPPPTFYCPVCMETLSYALLFSASDCDHVLCKDCATSMVLIAFQSKNVPVSCAQCSRTLDSHTCSKLIGAPKHKKEYELFCLLAAERTGISQLAYCSNAKCGTPFDYRRGDNDVPSCVRCPICEEHTCVDCKSQWHAGMSCEQYKMRKRSREGDSELQRLAKRRKWKPCPTCGQMIGRSEGCDHMRCRCGCDFCYKCGKPFMSEVRSSSSTIGDTCEGC